MKELEHHVPLGSKVRLECLGDGIVDMSGRKLMEIHTLLFQCLEFRGEPHLTVLTEPVVQRCNTDRISGCHVKSSLGITEHERELTVQLTHEFNKIFLSVMFVHG